MWFYLGAAALGAVAALLPAAALGVLEAAIWPLLALLLFATFTQVPIRSISAALRDRRFLIAALIGNFVILPILAWALIGLIPADDGVRLGLLLVLLVPCTDWFITFARLGGGDAAKATALTPINLLVQLLALPMYLALFAGPAIDGVLRWEQLWPAIAVVLIPLVAAALLEGSWQRSATWKLTHHTLALGPVPLLAMVIFAVVATHAPQAFAARNLLPVVAAVVVVFLIAALLVARALAAVARLSAPAGATLAFSLATRNSFVVLPIALALPAGWEIAAVVIVLQSLVELLAMIACLRLIPRLFKTGN